MYNKLLKKYFLKNVTLLSYYKKKAMSMKSRTLTFFYWFEKFILYNV
jgi:hypothetical protein